VSLNALRQRAVVHGILKLVRLARPARIGEHGDVDQNLLGLVALPVVDADDPARPEVLDDDFVQSEPPRSGDGRRPHG
jgi:hypothetical protein